MTMTVHPSLQGGALPRSALGSLPREPAFPAEEYRTRLAAARAAFTAAKMDALLVSNPASVLYLSGYQTFSVLAGETLIVPSEGDPVLVVPSPELGTALLHTWLESACGFDPERSAGANLAERLRECGLGAATIGVEKDASGLTPSCLDELRQMLPDARFEDATQLLVTLKAVKSERELACHRRAAPMTDAGMAAAMEAAVEGGSDNAVASAAAQTMLSAGSEYMCVAPIVTTGARSGILHSSHKRKELHRGDSVCVEIGACYERYTTPLMRTASIGPPTPGVQRLADACLRALDCVLEALRPGLTGHEVAETGWKGIAAAGEDLVFHGCFGYGVGAGFPPTWADRTGLIMSGQHTPIRPGMVFHHPVALRRLGEHGVMFSETSVVTETGCEPFGNTERRLFVC